MTTTFRVSFALVCAAAVTFATFSCSNSSGGSGGGGSPDGSSGGVIMSCSLPGDLCTQVVALPSEQAGEEQQCAKQGGAGGATTFAVAPCPTAGSFGCCTDPAAAEMQCAYNQDQASVLQGLCNNGKIWSGPDGGSTGGDGGATGAAAFVGTWARSGTQTITCPTGNPTTNNITGNLVIALGSASDTIVGTPPDGCQTNYSVSGNVATAAAGQSCNITTEAGIAETITVVTHTFTLSADGKTLDAEVTSTIDKTATNTTCTAVSSGTYTKQ
jgi:hypothetical protein